MKAAIVVRVVLLAFVLGAPWWGTQRSVLAAVSRLVYGQPPTTTGVFLRSSRLIGNNHDGDQYVWDNFQLASRATITDVRWRGAYDPANGGAGGPVQYFTVAIYPSLAGGSQPDIALTGPLVTYQTANNAGETLAGTFNGVTMYDYNFALPAPFSAAAGTIYWIHIEAWQNMPADWGITTGSGGNSYYYRGIAGISDITYQGVHGADANFSLYNHDQTLFLPVTYR